MSSEIESRSLMEFVVLWTLIVVVALVACVYWNGRQWCVANLRYLSYLIRHKWFVLLNGLRVGAPLWRLLVHDWTKFSALEWSAYRDYFYGHHTPRVDAEFERAWAHHVAHNPHHWEFWQNDGSDPFRMPSNMAREMLADWAGAGRAIRGQYEVLSWYAVHRRKIVLHADTRQYVEWLLDVYYKELEGKR